MEGFAWLKVDGAVLHLYEDVRRELAIERNELVVGLFGTIVRRLVRIDECTPDDDAAMWRQRPGEHVRAVGVGTLIVLRSGLAFGIRLDEETAEVGNVAVDLVDLGFPPLTHGRIERVGGLQSTELDGRAEPRGEIDAHAIGSQNSRERRSLLEISRREAGRVRIHIRQ